MPRYSVILCILGLGNIASGVLHVLGWPMTTVPGQVILSGCGLLVVAGVVEGGAKVSRHLVKLRKGSRVTCR